MSNRKYIAPCLVGEIVWCIPRNPKNCKPRRVVVEEIIFRAGVDAPIIYAKGNGYGFWDELYFDTKGKAMRAASLRNAAYWNKINGGTNNGKSGKRTGSA